MVHAFSQASVEGGARRSFKPAMEGLEQRWVPYATASSAWANANVSYSFMPDGTSTEGYTSSLYSELNAVAPTATWQREFAKALQTWANVTNLNFHMVTDDWSRPAFRPFARRQPFLATSGSAPIRSTAISPMPTIRAEAPWAATLPEPRHQFQNRHESRSLLGLASRVGPRLGIGSQHQRHGHVLVDYGSLHGADFR